MVKNFLAFLGLTFLILLVFFGVFLVTAYPDLLSPLAGIIKVPPIISTAGPVSIMVSNGPTAVIEKKNLVDSLPTLPPVPSPTPVPTDTPVPTPTSTPDPVIYQTEVMIRVKRFASAMDNFTATNDKLEKNPALMDDSTWQREMQTTLDDFVSAAVDMGSVSAVPPQYKDIQSWLEKVGPEAKKLKEDYLTGIQTKDQKYFQAVTDDRTAIIDDMTKAVAAMQAAGWQP